MQFVYNTFIYLYSFYIRLASSFSQKAKLWIDGRKNLKSELKDKIRLGEKYIWFHVSSLGEFEQGKPIIEKIKSNYPDHKILLSFFSPSGYEIKKNDAIADVICYLPSDTKANANWFINLVMPELVIFVKYDFWFNYLQKLQQKKIPTVFISSIFRSDQYFFKSYGKWFVNILKGIDHFFVQDKSSKDLLQTIGINQCTISGDTRFDRVADLRNHLSKFPFIEHFKGNNKLLIAGSTWYKDEELILELLKENIPGLKVIIAPHEIDATHITTLITKFKGINIQRYSTLDQEKLSEATVLIIDTIGMLSKLYHYATFTYIGGGFGKGIHNILEAATYGKPVIFGPNHQKFREAKELILYGGAFEISQPEDLISVIANLMSDQVLLENYCKNSRNYIDNGTGANEIIIAKIKKAAFI